MMMISKELNMIDINAEQNALMERKEQLESVIASCKQEIKDIKKKSRKLEKLEKEFEHIFDNDMDKSEDEENVVA